MNDQPSLSEVEYAQRRRVPKREEFLNRMDQVVPWADWVGLIQPYYYNKARGRRPIPVETMLRMYLLQVWFHLSDEGVEDQINDSFAMRQFMRLDFGTQQVPDATTLLHFRHLLETHQLGQAMFAALNARLEADGLIMRGGSIVDATIIAAPSSTKNATATRDPEMRQTRKGQQWYFGMKAHAGVDAGTGLVHSVTVTAASVHDLDEITGLVRADDQVVYADAGYQGVEKRPEITCSPAPRSSKPGSPPQSQPGSPGGSLPGTRTKPPKPRIRRRKQGSRDHRAIPKPHSPIRGRVAPMISVSLGKR